MLRRALLLPVFAFAVLACSSPTDPHDSPVTTGQGRLTGTVTIGPNCPGPETSNPCPPSPDAYKARKILVYNEAKTELLNTVDIDTTGHYGVDLAPGRYTVDLRGSGVDTTSSLP